MGLNIPADLAAWRRWQAHRSPLAQVRGAVAGLRREPQRWLLTAGERPRILLATDSTSPSTVLSLFRPLTHLDPSEVAVLSPASVEGHLPAGGWSHRVLAPEELDGALGSVTVVAGAGHYLPIGGAGWELAQRRGIPYAVVQHGLMTPWAPPLPSGARLLAWSEEDAGFWASGRSDIRPVVVGSQLLTEAARVGGGGEPGPLVYLGQLHAAELDRSVLATAAEAFCSAHDATYRPHPAERDRRSRRIHEQWRARGVRFDTSGVSLATLGASVVSVFSTGVLETAAAGRPAWVDHPEPPPWLTDFWRRYGMARWGSEPTPAPAASDREPALAVAEALRELA